MAKGRVRGYSGLMPRGPLAFVLLLLSLAADAQVLSVQPPHPSSIDNVVLDIGVFLPELNLQPIVRTGSEIRITFRGFSETPIGVTERVSLGQLPAGVYSVIVIHEFTDPYTEGEPIFSTHIEPPFVLIVTQGYFVPVMEPRTLFALALAVAFAGFVALK